MLSGMGKSCTEKVTCCQGWENRAQRKLYIVRDEENRAQRKYCQCWKNLAQRKLYVVRDGKLHRESYTLLGGNRAQRSYVLSGMGKSCTEKV